MRIGLRPDNLLERTALALGLVPTPFGDTLPTLLLARSVMAATRAGLFEALAGGPLTGPEIAARCGTHPGATQTFLDMLVSARYLRTEGMRYRLTPVVRRWLLRDSPQSLYDNILYRFLEWDWIARLDGFLETGRPLDIHAEMSPEQWSLYQRGMLCFARLSAPEMARRTPVPKGAREMLDIGGSHGYFSVLLCRRHPSLRSTVLDLPSAIEHAAPLLAREEMGDRVIHRTGNALRDDLGEEAYDLVLLSQLAHHFDDPTNRELVRRITRALRPGGVLVIQEILRRESPEEGGQLDGLLDLYFALTSESGTWSFAEMAEWQKAAGLTPKAPIRFRTMPGIGLQVGVKRAR
jgi:2-polyprenyl-3-methyl-5-hydroxy-6-metoxy-1,4-benzoquinol methylase